MAAIESWKDTWRRGLAPHLSTLALGALRAGLAHDDPALVLGVTCRCHLTHEPRESEPIEGACPLGYAAWQGDGLACRAEVETFFDEISTRCGLALGEPAAVRWFANWWDEGPRDHVRPLLLEEVEIELSRRLAGKEAGP